MTTQSLPVRSVVLACAFLCGLVVATSRGGVIYTEDFDGPLGGQPVDWVTDVEKPTDAVSQLAGDSEYEQRMTVDSGTIKIYAGYGQSNETDQAMWRDTAMQAILRFSGGASGAANHNGFAFRGRNPGYGSGDYYHVRARLNNSIQLYRVNGGAFSLLAADSVGALFNGSTENLMKITVTNQPDVGTDNVHIQATLYDSPTDQGAILRSIDYIDTSDNALTRAGAVGFRTYFDGDCTVGSRSTYDSLQVSGLNDRLLWFDDYSGNKSLRIETFLTGTVFEFVSGRLQFRGMGNGELGIALVDFDTVTSASEWEDVQVTCKMRLTTNAADDGRIQAGLIVRETGVIGTSGPGSFYHYRLQRDEPGGLNQAELWRNRNGSWNRLANVSLSPAQVPESADIFLNVKIRTRSGVPRIEAMTSLNADFSDSYGDIDYSDASADRLTGPGSVGYRARGGDSTATSPVVNFDNLTVTTVPAQGTLFLAH